MWRKYGSMPEFYNLGQQDCMQGREAYPLRPGISKRKHFLFFFVILF